MRTIRNSLSRTFSPFLARKGPNLELSWPADKLTKAGRGQAKQRKNEGENFFPKRSTRLESGDLNVAAPRQTIELSWKWRYERLQFQTSGEMKRKFSSSPPTHSILVLASCVCDSKFHVGTKRDLLSHSHDSDRHFALTKQKARRQSPTDFVRKQQAIHIGPSLLKSCCLI